MTPTNIYAIAIGLIVFGISALLLVIMIIMSVFT